MVSALAGRLGSCLFLLMVLPHLAAAQSATESSVWDKRAIPLFRHLEFPRDLPSTAESFAQDKTGMIWIGTQDGLVRWDGYRSRVFRHDPRDPLSLPGNFVTGLTVGDDGALFIATSTGVIVRFDPVEEHFMPLPAVGTATGYITNAFITDGKQGLWVGNSGGLSHFNAQTGQWEAAALPSGDKVWSLLLAHDGILWVGTEQGLLRYNPATASFTPVVEVASKSASAVRALFQSSKGEIWFGQNDGAVGLINGDGTVKFIESIQKASPIKAITEFKPGVLSVASIADGISFVDMSTGRLIQSIHHDPGRPTSIGGGVIYSEFLDRSGGLWIGHERGADYLPPGTGAFLSLLPSDRDQAALSGRNIFTILARPDGNLLVGVDNRGEVLSPLNGRESGGFEIPGAVIRGLATTGSDQTWISTSQGLFLYEGGKTRQIPALANIPMVRLYADPTVLWIGTERRGLVRLDTASNNITFFVHDPQNPNSLSDNLVTAVVRDHKGQLWIATSHGLNRFENGQFTQFHHDPGDANSLPSDMVLSLLPDRQGRLWLATQGGGIAVLEETPKGVKIRRITSDDGLASDTAGKLVEDQQGQIWASTDTSLIRIDPTTFKTRRFGANDGLAISEFWAGSGDRAADGTLLFGGVGGLAVVHPNRIYEKEEAPPPIVATAAHIGGRAQSPLKPLILPPSDHNLQVEFAALDYARSEKITYAYRLMGFDKSWTDTDSDHRQATYTNLPPGHYVLQLRASASKGVWTNPPAQISVTVLPAWYQTWWFRLCLALAGFGAIVIFVRSRTALLRRRQKELEGQVAEQTAEIASLLHNSGEGFLSFGPTLIIDRQYSRACETFLGEIPAGKNAAALLFAENPRHVGFVTESVPTALGTPDPNKRELILSLLPKEIDRRGRRLKLHYAIIENGHLMVVLRDITTERRLTERVASEHRRLEMIVAAVTDGRDFFDAVSSYELFINSELPEMIDWETEPAAVARDIYRSIHTFKGIFNQFSFERTPSLLHQLEEQLDGLQRRGIEKISDVVALFDLEQLTNTLNQDLAIIRQALGEEFLSKGGHVTMPPVQAARIKQLASRWRRGETFDPDEPEIRDLLDEIERVGSVSLRAELSAYDQTIAQVARRMEKEVAPLALACEEDVWLDPDLYGPFLRSLIHVFRNCVAHGIEAPDARIEAGKDELGVISCDVEISQGNLLISIADDGCGVDIPALRRRVAQSGRIGSEKLDRLSDQEILDFIFHDNISTAAAADDWSGRGVGLAAVRQQVERLGGSITVHTERGHGTRFVFSLELERPSLRGAMTRLLREPGI